MEKQDKETDGRKMRNEAERSVRQIGGVVNHSAQGLWPLWVCESCISTRARSAVRGRTDSLKTVSWTRQGRIWSAAVQVRSTHFPAHVTGNDLWAPGKRALEKSISCLDGKVQGQRAGGIPGKERIWEKPSC